MLGISIKEIIEFAVVETLKVSSNNSKIYLKNPNLLSNKILNELTSSNTRLSGANATWLTIFIESEKDLSESVSFDEVHRLIKKGYEIGLDDNEAEYFLYEAYSIGEIHD